MENKITSFMLPDDTRKKVKHICVEQDISLGEFLRQAVEEKLKKCDLESNTKDKRDG